MGAVNSPSVKSPQRSEECGNDLEELWDHQLLSAHSTPQHQIPSCLCNFWNLLVPKSHLTSPLY